MYKAVLHLVPWPKGSVYVSLSEEKNRSVELLQASTDTEAIHLANASAKNLVDSLCLVRCEVVRVIEVIEREVTLK
jgi:hypothetical protein